MSCLLNRKDKNKFKTRFLAGFNIFTLTFFNTYIAHYLDIRRHIIFSYFDEIMFKISSKYTLLYNKNHFNIKKILNLVSVFLYFVQFSILQ
jgi:hypothetical protein